MPVSNAILTVAFPGIYLARHLYELASDALERVGTQHKPQPGMLRTGRLPTPFGVDERQGPMTSSLISPTICTLAPRTRVSSPVSSPSSHRTSK